MCESIFDDVPISESVATPRLRIRGKAPGQVAVVPSVRADTLESSPGGSSCDGQIAVLSSNSGSDTSPAGKAPKPVFCLGCRRQKGVSPSFLVISEVVEWMYENRGSWCKDCYCVHRTVLSGTMSLTVLASHIRAPANAAEFYLMLIAYIMLKKDYVCF